MTEQSSPVIITIPRIACAIVFFFIKLIIFLLGINPITIKRKNTKTSIQRIAIIFNNVATANITFVI